MDHQRKCLQHEQPSLLDGVAVGVCAIDAAETVTVANAAALRMLGWKPQQVTGRPAGEILRYSRPDATNGSAETSPIRCALHQRRPFHSDQGTLCRQDGTSFPVILTVMPVDQDGEFPGAVVTFRDITQRQNLQLQLLRAQKLESIGRLAAGIAHEINTPIQYVGDNVRFLQEAFQDLNGALTGIRQLITDAPDGQALAPLLDKIDVLAQRAELEYLVGEIPVAIQQALEGIERVATIARAMKEFSHPAATEKKPIDLHRAIESTVTVARNEWKYVSDLTMEFDPNMPMVPCLPGELNQVILNLIINAAHAIGDVIQEGNDKGRITIRTHCDGVWAEVRISDTGTGIPKEHQAKIFDLFFTTKEVGKGTGQGLSFAQSVICEKHAGTISFETEAGQGTTFIVRLPIKPVSAEKGGEIEQEAHSLC